MQVQQEILEPTELQVLQEMLILEVLGVQQTQQIFLQ